VNVAQGKAAACVDLHMHSTASDGARSPSEVVRAARDVGLSAIALTDHDTVDGIAEAQAEGDALGIRIVPGVELSAVEADAETHLLGLHLREIGMLEARLHDLREMRLSRAGRIVAKLNELGIRVTLEAVLAQAGGGAVGRPHIARALVNEGWATDLRDAFDRYLGNGKAAFVPKEQLSIADAIMMIHDAGGLAILAHPGQAGTKQRVEALLPLGLDGLEVRHPSHSAEDATRLLALVEHFRLTPSGGSDWHGATEGGRSLGMMRVPLSWLERQDSVVAQRRPTLDEGPQAYVA